ncbi:hypothetical protein BDZ90DRAFT_235026 [Jaminaea rosea]|uniref:Elongation factor 2 n=1 Tax=Jaminaea rosea TaxID=1569628 RepID=A0A316UH13_9BASI|nr:hypothetical protein BDZ90DRAFT_235026 [Jaminaea rosea]PWN24480.1 hypothetical protein BDZ90DRAFT_235026 [Jaminaea rosea]
MSGHKGLLALTLMGHVDHGKSSYADSLLASNGLISQRQAGKIRYLDSREDEQQRGITIESSGIRLGFKMNSREGDQVVAKDWTLNLIDTPGHIDFSSEVSTSSRLVDGCLILVDALEGVCTQTINVLRQAWNDRLKPILVLNKLDRLAVEVRMSPQEAEAQLQRVLEQANAALAEFWAEERLQDEERQREIVEARGEKFTPPSQEDQQADDDLYFDPPRGNVIFASSLYGFAFRLHSFSHLYSKKLSLPEEKFRSFLWGDWFFDAKGRRMLNRKQATKMWGEGRLGPTACQQFVLDNVWRVFEKTVIQRDQDSIEKIASTLSLPLTPRELKNPDSHALLTAVLSAWLPLAPCTFAAIVDQIPQPAAAQGRRIPRILDPTGDVWPSESTRFYADKVGMPRPEGRTPVERDLFAARGERDAWRVAVISKMFAVAREDLASKSKQGEAADKAGAEREDVRNLSVEERRRRAREAREKHEAAKAAATGASDATSISGALVSANGSAVDRAIPDMAAAEPIDSVALDANYSVSRPRAAPQNGDSESRSDSKKSSNDEGATEVLLAFVRVLCGSLTVAPDTASSRFFLVLPKYDPTLPPTHASNVKHIKRVPIEALYVIMGKELVAVDRVGAGEVCAVQGLEGIVGRMGTLVAIPESESKSNTEEGDCAWLNGTAPGLVNLTSGAGLAPPIVRVALEPDNPSDLPKLVSGLRLLNQSDPCVQTLQQSTGEHVIVAAGELHLERCLKDLRERFARCAISASKPLVPYRETALRIAGGEMRPPALAAEGEPRGTVKVSVCNGAVTCKVRAKPLPEQITMWLEANAKSVRALGDAKAAAAGGATEEDATTVAATAGSSTGASSAAAKALSPEAFFSQLSALFVKAGSTAKSWDQEWKEPDLVERIWAFGPRRIGPNVLIGLSDESARRGLVARAARRRDATSVGASRMGSGLATPKLPDDEGAAVAKSGEEAEDLAAALERQANIGDEGVDGEAQSSSAASAPTWTAQDLYDSLELGFQLATLTGPLCGEPVRGLAYFLSDLQVNQDLIASQRLRLAQVSSSLIAAVRSSCGSALLDWSPRLMLATYECDVVTPAETLGKVHGVLAKRRGKVLKEEMREAGSAFGNDEAGGHSSSAGGMGNFVITASLPVVESFGFADEIRTRTSGAATPLLVFRGFEVYDEDPFWVPTTEEELEDLGDKGERENIAKRYVDAVRRRKGMRVMGDRLVEAAEKQRTLKSN